VLSNRDFQGILNYYTQYGVNGIQFQQMAGHYIGTIADILEEFDGNQHSRQFYEDISWVGLYRIKDKNSPSTVIYTDAWKSLSISNQQRYYEY